MTIRFLKNPTGMYRLSYEVGEVVDLPDSQAKELVEDGFAEQVGGQKPPDEEAEQLHPGKKTAESKVKPKKR